MRSTIAAKVILEKLGVQSIREMSVEEFKEQSSQPLGNLFSSEFGASTLIAPFSCLEFISSFDAASNSRELRLPKTIKRVFLHSMESSQNCEQLLRNLLGDSKARLIPMNSRNVDFTYSREETNICGPLTGLTIRSNEEIACWGFVLQSGSTDKVHPLIESNSESVLIRLRAKDLDLFMLFTSHLGDPNTPVEVNLDIRACLFSYAAPVMVLKYLSRGIGWTARNNYANLIIDDVPLSLRYGCIDFRKICDQAAKRHVSMTLAYIPLNYRRGSDECIRFFKKRSDAISFCIHGCNHTGSEFGGTDAGRISTLASLASYRMKLFSERTGLPHTKIMVFPQGIFSAQAFGVLKTHNFNAAINTELRNVAGENCVAFKDMLEPAITSYHSFPLFLRRKVSDGLGNVAFDLLLDKPCLIVTHHDDFCSDAGEVWQLIDAINALPNPPEWRSIEDLVARTVISRNVGTNLIELKVYSGNVDLVNLINVHGGSYLHVVKSENHPETISNILVGQREAEWHIEEGRIIVMVGKHLEGSRLSVHYRQDQLLDPQRLRLSEMIVAYCRGRLCELRDNLAAKAPAMHMAMRFVKKFL